MNFLQKILNKLKPAPINVGDKFIDKDWGETIIEIIKLHQTKDLVKYRFLQIDNVAMPNSSVHENTKWLIRSKYTKL